MNDFFQNMLKQTSTNISKINSTINNINNNIPNSNTNSTSKANSETMDLSPAGIFNTVTKLINPQAAKTFLQGSGVNEAEHAFSAILTGDAARVREGVKGLLNAFNVLELPFPIITNGATVSTKNTFTSAEIDAMSNAVGDAVEAYGKGTNAFVNYLYNNVDASGVGTSWENANNLAAENLKSAFSAGQIAHIDAYDGAAGAGADQEIARAQAIVSGGQAASENFDATKVATSYGEAIGKTVDNVGKALTGGASAVMNTVDMQQTKNSLVSGLDALTQGSGTAFAQNANLRQNSINNLLDALGFNPNGTWNGNINPVTAVPQAFIALRDIIQTYDYIPQIAYDGAINSILNISKTAIANKNAQYGETKDIKVYTSLGDSVQSGLGFKDYYKKFVNGESNGSPLVANTVVDESAPALVAEALGAECNQYHMPAATTSELLYALNPDKYSWAMDPVTAIGVNLPQFLGYESAFSAGQYSPETLRKLSPQIIEDLKQSDVITVDIGWNDIWSMVLEGQGIRSSVQYALILSEIYQINPNAEVVLVGGYNPFEGWDVLPFADDNLAGYMMQGVCDALLNSNKLLACMLYPGKCTYADTRHSEIITGTPSFGLSLDDLMYNPHPTEEGAKHQANGILEALGKERVYEEAKKGDFYMGEKNFTEADTAYGGILEFTPDEYQFVKHGIEDAANKLRPYTQTNLNPSNGETNSRSSFLTNMAEAYGNSKGSTVGNIGIGAIDTAHSIATNVLPGMITGGLRGELANFLTMIIPGL